MARGYVPDAGDIVWLTSHFMPDMSRLDNVLRWY
jgi:hypothetical protein